MKFIKFIFLLGAFAAGFTACGGSDPVNSETDDPGDAAYLTVTKRSYTADSDGGTVYVSVSSNRTFTATSEKSWCKAEILTGNADNLKLTVSANTSSLERTAGILLEAPGCSPVEVTVTQDAFVEEEEEEGDKEYLEFRAASYNIRYNSPDDIASGNGWSVRHTQVANLFHKYGFDIAGTQEASNSQLDLIMPQLGGYSYFKHAYGGKTDGTAHNCITFYKTSMFTLLDSGVYYYSQTPDVVSKGWDGDYRICSWGKFREKATGIEFFFFNSHFYWQGTQARPPSGPLHVEKTKAIAGSYPAISTGDFNSTPSTSQVAAIMTLYSDAFFITETPRVGPEGTGFAGGVFTGSPGGRIDYVFLKGFKARDYKVLEDQYLNGNNVMSYPSDHLPVTSKVAIEIPKTD